MSGLLERLNRHRKTMVGGERSGREAQAGYAGPDAGMAGSEAERHGDETGEAGAGPTQADRRLVGHGWEPIEAELVGDRQGAFVRRRRRYPLDHRHGSYRLGELTEHAGALAAFHADGVGADGVTAERLLFFDTETTGLGVGAGNVPFMLGLGYYEADAFVVEQLMIRNPAEEAAMLAYVNGLLPRFTHLITYNGRSFDWPIVLSRYVLCRMEPPECELRQLDFLYPSRSLWQGTMPSCRLGAVEEERLGYERVGDVSGALAPTLYFHYLADGDAGPLYGVFVHNERDILSLAGLAIHLAYALSGQLPIAGLDGEQLYRLGLWLDKMGKPELAERALGLLLERPAGERRRMALGLAAYFKRKGELARAVALWKEAAQEARRQPFGEPDALVELAIAHEHRLRDPHAALRYAEEALRLAQQRASLLRRSAKPCPHCAELRHRVERLQRKCAAGGGPQQPQQPRRRGARKGQAVQAQTLF